MLKVKDPSALKKVVVVTGDVAFENLGISEEDMKKITREVSVVFHCAAAISFMKPLRYFYSTFEFKHYSHLKKNIVHFECNIHLYR